MPLQGAPRGASLRDGVRSLLGEFSSLLDEHLDSSGKAALRQAHLSASEWQSFGRMLSAVRDVRVQALGNQTLAVVRESSGDAAAVQRKLQGMFQARKAELQRLRDELVPGDLSGSLRAWAEEQQPSKVAGFVGGMLSPQALQEMSRRDLRMPQSPVQTRSVPSGIASHVRELAARVQSAPGAAGAAPTAGHVAHLLRRRLDTWYHPELNTVELTFSIIAVALVCVLEILIHLNILLKDFSMPTWAWILVVAPTEGTAVATCLFGLTLWCDIIFGAVGLNVLDLFLT